MYLEYKPPFLYDAMLRFLAGRAIPGVELVTETEYLRTVRLNKTGSDCATGWIRVEHVPQKNALSLTVSESLAADLPQVSARIRHLFDLDCEPQIISAALETMNEIRPDLCVPGTRLPGCFDAFEMVVRAVLGQQITVKAATTLAGRFVSTFGKPLECDVEGLSHVFPRPEEIVALEGPVETHLGPLGVISTRARTIGSLAQTFTDGSVDYDRPDNPETEIEKLLTIRGIGPWTARYIAMRTMGWTDAFLETDAGIKKALSPLTPKEMLSLAKQWKPWRSYATVNLWNSL